MVTPMLRRQSCRKCFKPQKSPRFREGSLILNCKLGLLRALNTVFGPLGLTIFNRLGVKATTDNRVTYTWKVTRAAAAYENNTMLLQVMAFARDVARHCVAVR